MQAVEAVAREGSVSTIRREVRQACLAAAKTSPGIFSLTVPTGGGKTLASLSFALEHAAKHGMDRVVVAIPFTSITEQSADAYRRVLADESSIVLEHHSAFDDALLVSRRRASGAGSRAIFRETSWNRLASENWDAPLVVTTTVQLFESLFSNRSGRCRKLHRLARSVIVLDEAQTVPVRYLDAILDVLKTLVRDYGASVVLCTATQPAWGPEVLGARGIPAMHEIYPNHRQAFSVLRRVRVQWPSSLEPTPYEQIAREMASRDDAMAIVHLRDDARKLCTLVDDVVGDDRCVHLSALMCAEHRRAVLRSVRERKARREPVRLVATQLVEAGVDLDFAVVFRAMAGLDALAQAAGRCNREGLLGVEGGLLRVFVAETEPPRGPLQDGLDVARTMLAIAQAEGRTLDLFDPETVREYFTRYYRATSTDHDKREIQELRAAWNFATVAEQVRIIDEWAVPVVVPWGEGPTLLTELQRALDAGAPPGRWLRKLQAYSVNVRRELVDQWLKEAKVVAIGECALAIPSVFRGAYSERFGLDVEQLGVVSVGDTVL
jgi:CRISPR-associated endonuclease/helicase Cas3